MCLKKLKLLEKFSPFNFLMLLIDGVINAIGVTLFIAPDRIKYSASAVWIKEAGSRVLSVCYFHSLHLFFISMDDHGCSAH